MCLALLPAALPLQLELRQQVPGKRGRDLLLLEAEQEQPRWSMIKFKAATSWERSAPAGRVTSHPSRRHALALLPAGFTNCALRAHLAPLLGLPPEAMTSGQLSYDLRRLRAASAALS